MSTQPAIVARGIAKAYEAGAVTTPVLRGIDLDVMRGECVFLAGPSGSGKSTLLSILGCILTPDAGVLHILGDDVTQFDETQQARFRRKTIGIVFQRFHLFRGLTASENVRTILALLGWAPAAAKQRAEQLLTAIGLADKLHGKVSQMSMGQRQRVALARALAGDPELILADEPTASLDAASGTNAMAILKRLSEDQGKTVVVVTHDARIFHFADRILELQDGLIADATADAQRPAHCTP